MKRVGAMIAVVLVCVGAAGVPARNPAVPGQVAGTSTAPGAALNVLDRPLLVLKYKGRADLAAFSPDGRMLASEGDHMVRVTDLRTGEALRVTRNTPYAHAMSFAPDGKLVLASNVGTLEVLSLPTLVAEHSLRVAEGHNVYALAVSADSARAAAAEGGGGIIKLFEIGTEKELRTLGAKGARNAALAFSPDGKRLAALNDEGRCDIYDTQTGELVKSADKVGGYEAAIRFDAAGEMLGLGARGTSIHVWKMAEAGPEAVQVPEVLIGRPRINGPVMDSPQYRTMDAPLGDFASGVTALSGDLATAASVLENGNTALWDVRARKLLHIFPTRQEKDTFGGGVSGLSFSAAGDLLVTTSRTGLVSVWRIRGAAEPVKVEQPIDASVLPGEWGPALGGLRTRLILEPEKPGAPNRMEGPPLAGRPLAMHEGVWWRVSLQIKNETGADLVVVWPEIRVPEGLVVTREGEGVAFLAEPRLEPVREPHPSTVQAHDVLTANSIMLGRMHDMARPGKYRMQFPKTETPGILPKEVTNRVLPESNVVEFEAEK